MSDNAATGESSAVSDGGFFVEWEMCRASADDPAATAVVEPAEWQRTARSLLGGKAVVS